MAYMNEDLFKRYITNYLLPVLGGRPKLFAMDLMGSHKIPAVLPLDVSVNKPLKDRLRFLTSEQICKLESGEEFEKWTIRDCRIMTTFCVIEAFYGFHNEKGEVICRSFRKVGLALPIDGSLDHELDIKGFAGLEIGNWRQDLGPLSHRSTMGNVEYQEIEFVSTELEV
ncbi:hypothetical protein HOY82DRAFT_607667 [Tuber indicum]|nr:hypothetical protein HOY82DRAFT_607667 [Tuber indicum]